MIGGRSEDRWRIKQFRRVNEDGKRHSIEERRAGRSGEELGRLSKWGRWTREKSHRPSKVGFLLKI